MSKVWFVSLRFYPYSSQLSKFQFLKPVFQMFCDYVSHTYIYIHIWINRKKMNLFLGSIFLAKVGIAWNWCDWKSIWQSEVWIFKRTIFPKCILIFEGRGCKSFILKILWKRFTLRIVSGFWIWPSNAILNKVTAQGNREGVT